MPAAYPSSLSVSEEAALCTSFLADRDSGGGFAPRAIAKPRSIDEVQALISWANKASVNIIPVSSTGKRRRGDTVPRVPGMVICDLSGMRRLIHADRRDKIAILEAGVDFGTVDHLLRPHGLRAYRPLMPRAGKSVLASYLDREPVIVPDVQWDITDPFGGTAMVLGSGDLVKTGGAALEGTLEKQLAKGHRQMFAPGPAHIDLVRVVQGSQGSLGTMVWGAVYCEPLPAVENSAFASAERLDDVVKLAKDLMHRRICTTLFIVDNVQLAMLMADSIARFEELCALLPAWSLFVTQAGYERRPEQKLAWQQKDLSDAAARYGVTLQDALAGISAETFAANLRSARPQAYQDQFGGAHKELFFLQNFGTLEKAIDAKTRSLAEGSLSKRAVGTYIQPMVQGTFCHVAFTMPCTPDEARSGSPLDAGWQSTVTACAESGAFFSRPYLDWFDQSFANNTSARTMMKAAKDMLDPKGIMNPKRLPYGGHA